jgi:hypothetical protein
MKKVLFCALLVISGQLGFSQVSKNQWLVGGMVGFESAKYGDSRYTAFNFSPNAGYFFANKFAGGLRLTFESKKVKDAGDASSDLLFAPFLRYYFLPVDKKVNIFGDVSYGFGSAGTEDKSSKNEFAIQAGPSVFVSPTVGLEFTLYYKSAGGDAYGDERLNRFGLNVGFQVHLGNAKK